MHLIKTNKESGRTSIRARILRLGIINVIVAMTSLAIVSILIISIILNNLFTEEGTSLAAAYASMFNNTIATMRQDIEQFTTDAKIVDEKTSLADRKAYLDQLASHTMFKDLSIAYADGTTYNDTDLTDRKYFQEAMKGLTYISSPVTRKTDGSTVIMVGTPMHIDGFSGVLYGAIDASTLSAGFEEIVYGEESDICILDSSAQIVASMNTKDVEALSTFNNPDILAYMTETVGTFSANGYLTTYHTLDGTDNWKLVIRMNDNFISNVIIQSCLVILGLGIALLTLDIFICTGVANKLSKPIRQVTERLSGLAAGDINSTTEIACRKDETEDLSRALQTTLCNMQTYINDTSARLEALAGGDLTVHTDVEYVGDFTKLRSALDEFQGHLHDSFKQITEAVDSVHQGASQISEGAQHLSETSISQAAAATELQETMNGIAEHANNTANTAEETLALAESVTNKTLEGEQLLDDLMSAIKNIQTKSDAISNIVKTIEDISFQTNILSLNASIEAARAGEAGKGFSVVAGEVGNLASKSADATKQTATLIAESIEAVEKGTVLADKVKAQMEHVVKGIQDVSTKMQTVASAAEEQQTAVEQSNTGIASISDGLQSTTAAAEESAASSEELYSLADTLATEISKYKLQDGSAYGT